MPHYAPSQIKARSKDAWADVQLHHRKSDVPGEDFGLDPTGNRHPLKALSRLVLGLLSTNKLVTHAKPLSFKQGLKVPLCHNSFFFTQKSCNHQKTSHPQEKGASRRHLLLHVTMNSNSIELKHQVPEFCLLYFKEKMSVFLIVINELSITCIQRIKTWKQLGLLTGQRPTPQ